MILQVIYSYSDIELGPIFLTILFYLLQDRSLLIPRASRDLTAVRRKDP